MTSSPRTAAILRSLALTAILCFGIRLHAQQSFDQTLPPGFANSPATTSTAFPFNSANDQTWQWQYDAGLFAHGGPMLINRIYVRLSSPTATLGAFFLSDLTVTMGEASSTAAAASSTFAANFRRGEVLRSGPYSNDYDATGNGTVAGWIPIDLDRSFRYDPSTGNGLVIELRSCGTGATFGAAIDFANVPGATRRGDITSCTATVATTTYLGGAPLVKIDYTPILTQTLPSGFDSAPGNAGTAAPFGTSNDSIWQWHYDAGEFAATGPINIRDISVRASSAFATLNAFDFPSVQVTLIEASTNYVVGVHDPFFANNILRSKVVRAGRFTALPTTPSGTATAQFISLQLDDSFDYDPSTGNDLIVQVRVCGAGLPLFVSSIDGVLGTSGTVGGNRYGHRTDCQAVAQDFNNDEFVPIIQLGYVSGVVSSFPYNENFDLYGAQHGGSKMPPGWDSVEWQTMAQMTSSATASFDHSTMRRGVGHYVTLDDSFHSSSVGDEICSPWFDLSALANPVASFWLYSDSNVDPSLLDENALTVFVEIEGFGVAQVLPTLTTQGHSNWVRYAVDLSSYAPSTLRLFFRATSDSVNSFNHDFSIDSFRVRSALASEGGQAARPIGRLDVNGAHNNNGFHVDDDASGPYYTAGQAGGALNISIEGAGANQPAALWLGPLNIAVATFGPLGQMDTGTPDTTGDGIPENILLFGSGLNAVPSFNDLFYFTDATAQLNMSWQLYPFMPLGTIGTFQAATANGLGGIYLTNAVVLSIAP